MSARDRRPAKPTFRRDWMAEAVRDSAGTAWGDYLADCYRNERIRKGFNDAEDEAQR